MKIAKSNLWASLFLLCSLITACSDDEGTKLYGSYKEVSPQPKRTTLRFTGDKVVMTDIVSSALPETYYYVISANKIRLEPVNDPSSAVELQFGRVNSNEFWIENLYPGIPENPIIKMTFKK